MSRQNPTVQEILNTEPFIIASGDQLKTGTFKNDLLADFCEAFGLKVTRLTGCYQGEKENSLLITGLNGRNQAAIAQFIGKEFDQESYIVGNEPNKIPFKLIFTETQQVITAYTYQPLNKETPDNYSQVVETGFKFRIDFEF